MTYYKTDTADCSNSVIARISRWFKKAKPAPDRNDITTQLGVHFEEVGEMLDELTPRTEFASDLLRNANESIKALAEYCKSTEDRYYVTTEDRQNFLDALCDQIVTAVGSGVLLQMDVTGGIEEVSDSNDSKFDPATGLPILNEHGKIMKGSAYRKANLTPFV